MATGRKTGGRNFQPGVVTNPNGRPKIPDHLKKSKVIPNIKEIIAHMMAMNKEEFEAYAENPPTMLEAVLAKTLQESQRTGDTTKFNLLLERMVGKVPNVNQNEDITERRKELEEVPREQISALLRAVGNED
jgi:hypothetical protein